MSRPSDEARRRMMAAAEHALQLAAEDLLGRAQRIVPLDEGTLSASGTVSDVHHTPDGGLEVAVSFNTPYAARQHEETTYVHTNGRQAKYLEHPLAEMTARYERLIGEQVRRAL